MPIKSTYKDVEIPEQDIWEFLFERPAKPFSDDHVLFIDSETKRSYTYKQLRDTAVAFGKGLKSRWRWQRGDVVAFYSPNSIDTPAATWGVHWAGGIPSPANPLYTASELAYQLKDSGAKALVTQRACLPVALAATTQAGIPDERIVLISDERDETGRFKHFTEVSGSVGLLPVLRTKLDPHKDISFLCYSSGTTGLPKGVVLSHYNVVANLCQCQPLDMAIMVSSRDIQIAVLPFFHIYGLVCVVHWGVLSGIPSVVMARYDTERLCQLVQEYSVSVLYIPPPILLRLQKEAVVDKYDLSSLKILNAGAAPVSKELVDGLWERLKIGVKQGYGTSEASPMITLQENHEWARYLGSVGKLIPNLVAKIVGEDGNEVPTGQPGELLLKGPNIFKGYLNRATNEFTEDGFYKTGDVVYVDNKGNYYVTDRLKEFIKYHAFQVPPAELEGLLLSHADVADCCVVGVWHRTQHTEVPRAYIVLRDGRPATPETVRGISDWLAERVAPHKRLRGGIRFIDEVPKSPSGKILRRIIREKAKKEDQESQAKL